MKATRKTIPTLIEKREPFRNASGSVRGVKDPEAVGYGQLDEDEQSRLRIDFATVGLSYVVYSYLTPIAWETKTGHIYKVQQKFSQTTSQHQGLLYLFHPKSDD